MNARSRPARRLICPAGGRRIENRATLMARSPDGAKRNPGLCGEDSGLRSASPGLRHFETVMAKIPLGRPGRPDEVASMIAWLASDECSFSTGATFDLSGGRATY